MCLYLQMLSTDLVWESAVWACSVESVNTDKLTTMHLKTASLKFKWFLSFLMKAETPAKCHITSLKEEMQQFHC